MSQVVWTPDHASDDSVTVHAVKIWLPSRGDGEKAHLSASGYYLVYVIVP